LAENQFRGIDLGLEGQKMLEHAQAAKSMTDAAGEANLRQQQGIEMAALQAKQVAQQQGPLGQEGGRPLRT